MKKVKIFLTAIAVISVVGGALAFKASKNNGTLYCNVLSGSVCPSTHDYNQVDPPLGSTVYCGTTAGSSACISTGSATNAANEGQ